MDKPKRTFRFRPTLRPNSAVSLRPCRSFIGPWRKPQKRTFSSNLSRCADYFWRMDAWNAIAARVPERDDRDRCCRGIRNVPIALSRFIPCGLTLVLLFPRLAAALPCKAWSFEQSKARSLPRAFSEPSVHQLLR